MADKRREPIERNPKPAQNLPNPSAPKMSSTASETSFDVQEIDASSSKRKSTAKAKRIRKRRRIRYPKTYPEVGMSRLSSGSGRSGVDDRDSEQDMALGDIEDNDAQFLRASADEVIPDFDAAELSYVTNMITAASDGIVVSSPTPEGYASSPGGDFTGTNAIFNAATDILLSNSRPILRRQPSEYPSVLEATLPNPATSPNGPSLNDIIRVDSNFIRLNFALFGVLVHISTQELPSAALSISAVARIHAVVNTGAIFFPFLLSLLSDPSHVSKWARHSGIHLNSFWIRICSLIFVVIIKILVVVEVFQHLPLWIGILLLVMAVTAFVPFLVVVLVMNLLHDCHNALFNERKIRVVYNVVYGSLAIVHLLEMRPSILSAIMTAAAPSEKTSPVINIASLCFNLAIILQLPALFLEASCVGFCNCVVGRGGNSVGVASLLLTVLFQMSLSSFLVAIGTTIVANSLPTLVLCLYVGIAAIFMVLVGCHHLDILPVKSIITGKQRVE
ncbi:hypothetical protein SCHPADRAFT_938838 [Schizopora paradoxa]|uniref:Uncharacterized protein n=1 Tax=Schizopora paradoxa TaxID=27342 RepID=A0A0H2RUG2_9AGAM|nr:hypothetical protein SCHPADRAFT_938838 [Schizopora paradoxa]